MPRNPCLTCGTPTTNGPRCERCEVPVAREVSVRKQDQARRLGYSTPHWKRLRRRVLERDRGRCMLQLPGCSGEATSVHLHPDLEGDHRAATEDDCLSACAQCHGRRDGPRAHVEKQPRAGGAGELGDRGRDDEDDRPVLIA